MRCLDVDNILIALNVFLVLEMSMLYLPYVWWTSNKLHNRPLKTYRKAAPLKDCISIYLNCTLQLILKKYMKMLYYKKNISVLCGGQCENILVCTFSAFFRPFSLILRTTTMRFSPVGKRYEPSLEGLLKDCSALAIQSLKEYSQSWVTYLTKRIFFEQWLSNFQGP